MQKDELAKEVADLKTKMTEADANLRSTATELTQT